MRCKLCAKRINRDYWRDIYTGHHKGFVYSFACFWCALDKHLKGAIVTNVMLFNFKALMSYNLSQIGCQISEDSAILSHKNKQDAVLEKIEYHLGISGLQNQLNLRHFPAEGWLFRFTLDFRTIYLIHTHISPFICTFDLLHKCRPCCAVMRTYSRSELLHRMLCLKSRHKSPKTSLAHS